MMRKYVAWMPSGPPYIGLVGFLALYVLPGQFIEVPDPPCTP